MKIKGDKKISLDCLLACIYFVCLPFTVVTTPFGSLLKLVTFPVVLILSVRILMGKSDLTFNYIHFFYGIYILYTVGLLTVYAEDITVTTTKDMVLGALMLLLITIRVYNSREKHLMETAWILVGVICVYACFTSKEVVSQSESRTVIKIFGFEEDQNQFCAYLIMPILISVKRIIKKEKFWYAYIALIALSFYAILKTGSRGGLIGVFIGLLIYILIGIKSLKIRLSLVIATVFSVLIFYTAVMPTLPEDVRERYTVSSVKSDGGSGRFEIWQFLTDYTMQRPERLIRGSGIFSTYSIMYSAGFSNGVAHNAYIQILNDEGIIGLLLFLAVIALCIARNYNKDPVYMAGMAALLAFSMSLTFYVFKPYLNIMMMCALSFEGTLPQDRLLAKRKIQNASYAGKNDYKGGFENA